MKTFEYTVTEPVGIHARPAGMLSREAKKYKSAICVLKDGKSANVLRLMALMSLGVKCGETVKVTIEGEDEEIAAAEIEAFFKANL
jgi:phosphocarrier protein